jgi:phospho-N-acetylmuramoyl-pentapeptide-transferase
MKLLALALLSIFCYAVYIRVFKKASQYERELGLDSHKAKSGTVTMGGIIFVILPLFFIKYDIKTICIVIATTLFAVIGLIDDLLIVIKKNNDGINAIVKLILQIVISAICFYIYLSSDLNTVINIFNYSIDLKWGYGLLILLILVSSSNAFNITDGVDGLCAGTTLIMSIAFIYIAYKNKEWNILYLLIAYDIVIFSYWCFNLPKAFLFMGDTGSLALGALMPIIAINLNCIYIFAILALPFIFETLSVIIQVSYFKLTKGKRIFKMAPFHHHLEAIGFKELTVDILFYLIELILVIIVILLY